MEQQGNIQKKVMTVFDEKHKELFCVNEDSYLSIEWIPKEIKGIKLLRDLITRRHLKKFGKQATHEDILIAFEAFLDVASTVSNGFYKRIFTPMTLYSNFNNISTSYQYESSTKNNKSSTISETARSGVEKIDQAWASEGRRL